jgi:UTP-glucose-1-phosphate uridylyltransferase
MSPALERLHMAIDDLTRATIERDRIVARYILKTEIYEALDALSKTKDGIDQETMVDLLIACAKVEQELERDPR